MEWLTNPWVIGIGTTVIAGVIVGLILYFVFGIGKAKPRKQMSSSLPAVEKKPSSFPAVEKKPGSNLLPKEITEYLRSLPPLQEEAAAKNYKGIRVLREVNLESGHPLSNGKLHLMMLNKGKYPWVSCDVDPSHYPELKIIKKERVFLIEGEIKSVGGGIIELTSCRLRF